MMHSTKYLLYSPSVSEECIAPALLQITIYTTTKVAYQLQTLLIFYDLYIYTGVTFFPS